MQTSATDTGIVRNAVAAKPTANTIQNCTPGLLASALDR